MLQFLFKLLLNVDTACLGCVDESFRVIFQQTFIFSCEVSDSVKLPVSCSTCAAYSHDKRKSNIHDIFAIL